ncbi:fungal-specific transcription factor domain-containing protein, partial [Blyttiomyces helicus]
MSTTKLTAASEQPPTNADPAAAQLQDEIDYENDPDDDEDDDESREDDDNDNATATATLGKRTRTMRACDSWSVSLFPPLATSCMEVGSRRKRVKCTGQLPCASCFAFKDTCTYTPSARKRPAVSIQSEKKSAISVLETRLRTVEGLLTGLVHPSPASPPPDEDIKDAEEASSAGASADLPFLPPPPSSLSDFRHLPPPALTRFDPFVPPPGSSRVALVREVGSKRFLFYGGTSNASNAMWRKSPRFQDGVLSIPVTRDGNSPHPPPSTSYTPQELETIPCTAELVFYLVDIYFTHLHPFFPMINRKQFMKQLTDKRKRQNGVWSFYLLLNCMLALVTQYTAELNARGVTSSEEFHNAFFDRANALLTDNMEVPCLNTIQGLLLLCLCGFASRRGFNSWEFGGMAIRMAQEIGLHRKLSSVHDLSFTEAHVDTLRRTWFCAYIIDRYSSIATG